MLPALILLFAPSLATAQTREEQAPRPPPLPPETGCELWSGTVSGNDPSVQVRARLCPGSAAGRVSGVLQWSSTRSGWNLRAVEGDWAEGRARLLLRDIRVMEERPQPGWQFCPVDRYELAATAPGILEGTYDSAPCRDHATVRLRLESTAAPSVPVEAPVSPPRPPPPPSPAVGSCARCSGVGTGPGGGAIVAALLLLRVSTRAGSAPRRGS